jgi:hypothetical protein
MLFSGEEDPEREVVRGDDDGNDGAELPVFRQEDSFGGID